jgi:hypothetical protein
MSGDNPKSLLPSKFEAYWNMYDVSKIGHTMSSSRQYYQWKKGDRFGCGILPPLAYTELGLDDKDDYEHTNLPSNIVDVVFTRNGSIIAYLKSFQIKPTTTTSYNHTSSDDIDKKSFYQNIYMSVGVQGW